MGRGISRMAKHELLSTIRDRYQHATKGEEGRIPDESTAVTGLYRKHAIRSLAGGGDDGEGNHSLAGRLIYD